MHHASPHPQSLVAVRARRGRRETPSATLLHPAAGMSKAVRVEDGIRHAADKIIKVFDIQEIETAELTGMSAQFNTATATQASARSKSVGGAAAPSRCKCCFSRPVVPPLDPEDEP